MAIMHRTLDAKTVSIDYKNQDKRPYDDETLCDNIFVEWRAGKGEEASAYFELAITVR